MYVLCATFDPKLALSKVKEMLAMGEEAERLAQRLGQPDEAAAIKDGVENGSMKALVEGVTRVQEFLDIEKEIEQVENGRWAMGFMGKGFRDKKLKKLRAKRSGYGSLIDAPRDFYQLNRVRLLGLIRDFALDCAEQGDAEWIDTESRPLHFPLAEMFEQGDVDRARKIASALGKPFGNLDPEFVLKTMEGHRALSFDFEKNLVTFYGPIRGSNEEVFPEAGK
ncbi:MAG: hypothetical protein AAGK14_10350 [Verrucomicrobiota bacterium]